LLEDSERAGIPNRPARWRLRDDIRREALKRLAERGDLLRAVDANPDRDRTDPLQIVFERVLRREPFNLLDMTAKISLRSRWYASGAKASCPCPTKRSCARRSRSPTS